MRSIAFAAGLLSLALTSLAGTNAGFPDAIDRGIPDDEKAVLLSTHGYALPEPGEGVQWVGGELDWEDLKGKVVVIQSWTRKSIEGRRAVEQTQRMLDTLGSDDVVLVGLHTPDGAAGAEGYLERKPLPGPSMIDTKGAFCDELGIWKEPRTIIVDRNGTVRCAGVSLVHMLPTLQSILAETYDADATPADVLPPRDERSIQTADAPAPAGGAANAHRPAFPPVIGSSGAQKDLRNKKAPDLHVGEWITSRPSTEGKVVMIEFWATWCGPCIQNMPHLSKLQSKFRDSLVIVGVSAEDSNTVRNFLRRNGNRVNYSIAVDPSRRMSNAVGVRGIPHCIVVSPDGVVRWQGHPGVLKDATLKQIIQASGIDNRPTPSHRTAEEGEKRWVS